MNLAEVSTGIDMINHASSQSDRWLFLAMLMVNMAFAWYVIKWLVRRMTSNEEKTDKVTQELITTIRTNTDGLEKVRLMLTAYSMAGRFIDNQNKAEATENKTT